MGGNCKLLSVLLRIFIFLFVCSPASSPVFAAEEETIVGVVIKTEKGFMIEAEDGDYIVKGKDLSKMVGKMIEATGIITETDKGEVIDIKSFEEIRE